MAEDEKDICEHELEVSYGYNNPRYLARIFKCKKCSATFDARFCGCDIG